MKCKVRVLHVLGSLYRGGAETFVMNVFRHLDRDNVMFDFVVNKEGGDYEEEARMLGARIFRLPSRREGIRMRWKQIDDFFSIHGKDYAAVHCHASSLTSMAMLKTAKRYHIPIRIIHSHSSFPEGRIHRILHYLNQFRVDSYATHFFACSEVSRKWMYMLPWVRKKSVVVRNGIDVEVFRFDLNVRTRMRTKYGVNQKIVIGHVGRFHPIKNHEFLIDVFCDCLKEKQNMCLMLIGEGELISKIKEMVTARHIEDKVIFTGLQFDISSYLQAFDFFVFPSIKEGLPLSLIEAQCTGLPVIASDSIDSQSKILDSFVFCSLDNSSGEWADLLLKKASKQRLNRMDSWKMIRSAGFDIYDVVHVLEDVYCS